MANPAAESRSNRAAVPATNDDASANDDMSKVSDCHARWAALRELLFQFLESGSGSGESVQAKKQILSLAGFDTTYFQLQDEGKGPHLYVELDFKEVTSKKAAVIENSYQLRDKLGANASISIECVLIYLDPNSSQAIVSWASKTFLTAVFFLYEQIHPDDAFGHQMIRNLETRGCGLLSIMQPQLYLQRRDCFLIMDGRSQRAIAWDMLKIYGSFIDAQEKRRIERLELFDEFEEWRLMREHYYVTYAINDAMGLFGDLGFPREANNVSDATASSASL